MAQRPTLTTEAGAPVIDNQNSQTAGSRDRCCARNGRDQDSGAARSGQRLVISTIAAAAQASPSDCTGRSRSRSTTLASITVLAG